ncbi:uncharacterized [Tachysurus ichikawai]
MWNLKRKAGNEVGKGRLREETLALTHVDSVDTAVVDAEWRQVQHRPQHRESSHTTANVNSLLTRWLAKKLLK